MADDEIEEIRKLQLKRKVGAGELISFSSVSYDSQFYGGTAKPTADSNEYVTSIPVNDDEEEEDAPVETNSRKQFLRSFTAPQQFIDDTRNTKDEVDVFADFKKKTIGEKEDEYHARWRKRKLSPPRIDAFNTKKGGQAPSNATSYKDVMLDTQLEKEKQDLLFRIAKKQKDEREERDKEDRNRRKEIRKAKKEGRDVGDSPGESNGWRLDVMKNGERIEKISMNMETTYNMGRGENNNVRLDHGSCSKNHAKITFLSERPNLMDLNSTNGTELNGEVVTPGKYYPLSDKDVLKFGCSTREFHVKKP